MSDSNNSAVNPYTALAAQSDASGGSSYLPMLIAAAQGAGNSLIQSSMPSRIPVSGRLAGNLAILGAGQGISNAMSAQAQLPMYYAQLQQAQALAQQTQADANLKQMQLPGAAFDARLAAMKSQALSGMSGGTPSATAAPGGVPPSAGAMPGTAAVGMPGTAGSPVPFDDGSNTSQPNRALTPIDLQHAFRISLGIGDIPTSSVDQRRLATIYDMMKMPDAAKTMNAMADTSFQQESKGFVFDPRSNSWVINPVTTSNMQRSAQGTAQATAYGTYQGGQGIPLGGKSPVTAPVPVAPQGVPQGAPVAPMPPQVAPVPPAAPTGVPVPAGTAGLTPPPVSGLTPPPQDAAPVPPPIAGGNAPQFALPMTPAAQNEYNKAANLKSLEPSTVMTLVSPSGNRQSFNPLTDKASIATAMQQGWTTPENMAPKLKMTEAADQDAFKAAGTAKADLQAQISQLQARQAITSNPNFSPGFVQEHLQEMRNVAVSMGYASPTADANQVYNALATGAVFGMKNLEHITRLTNMDIGLFMKQVPQLSSNPNALRTLTQLESLGANYELNHQQYILDSLQDGKHANDAEKAWKAANPSPITSNDQVGINNMLDPSKAKIPMFKTPDDLTQWGSAYGWTLNTEQRQSLLAQRRNLMGSNQ